MAHVESSHRTIIGVIIQASPIATNQSSKSGISRVFTLGSSDLNQRVVSEKAGHMLRKAATIRQEKALYDAFGRCVQRQTSADHKDNPTRSKMPLSKLAQQGSILQSATTDVILSR